MTTMVGVRIYYELPSPKPPPPQPPSLSPSSTWTNSEPAELVLRTTSTARGPTLNEWSVLTRAVGSACTSNCEVVTMVSPSPPRDAAWTGLIGGDGVVTMMGGVRIYFSLHSPKSPLHRHPPSLSPYPTWTSSEPTEPALRTTTRKRDINSIIHVLPHAPTFSSEEACL